MSLITIMEDAAAEVAAPALGNDWADVEVPEFSREFAKVQTFKNRKAGEGSARKFNANGPKAEIIVKMVLAGGWTRQEMADVAGEMTDGSCSVSRVAEVVWTMEAAGLDISKIVKNRKAAK